MRTVACVCTTAMGLCVRTLPYLRGSCRRFAHVKNRGAKAREVIASVASRRGCEINDAHERMTDPIRGDDINLRFHVNTSGQWRSLMPKEGPNLSGSLFSCLMTSSRRS